MPKPDTYEMVTLRVPTAAHTEALQHAARENRDVLEILEDSLADTFTPKKPSPNRSSTEDADRHTRKEIARILERVQEVG